MRIDPIQIQKQSKLITDYRNSEENIMQYFDYLPFEKTTYQDRIKDLKERKFNRKKLSEALKIMNHNWEAPKATYENIERLTDENSVVVIGGQQAGLLTGPMYSINKLISIIQLARQQEEELQLPVIPVFWIAGEDHDFDEINHIFLPDVPKMKKYKLLQRVLGKKSVGHIPKDETYANQWLTSVFEQLKETEHTKHLFATVKDCLDKADNYVDFFARLIYQIFDDEGVVLVDSSNPEIRKLENDSFVNLLELQPEISKGVYDNERRLKQKGYTISLGVLENDAHIFYHKNGERVLLVRNDSGDWVGKQNEVLLTMKELITIAKEKPELLSNNVVTRPLMQELLFPSLAFIGGPGEISYWSALKPVFQAFKINMPPVIPRLSYTFVERNVEKLLMKYDLTGEYAVNYGVESERDQWLAAKNDPPIPQVAKGIKEAIDEAHRPLREAAKSIRSDLGDLADKNLNYLFCDIEFLEDRLMKEMKEKYAKELYEFNVINTVLRPNGGLQERMWNPLPWINDYGVQFIKDLTKANCSFENEHYLVYL
ncbi:bacillithiol biosynthesis cysteine-adding enzyme BshC [Virgibacillus oceani]|uniref:Putative cysteine ligase BshC n=1 Tax=Virgibacillus oceani TaxID=1479511 RepID=A0A917H898_9BACI|nr:bacillithiol biosynthesis cysteine-adding enzyme BshC [Virgibacillus oceani]GGG69857.1 putative cysteine ligase BshC [Virgibacillus oceani]